MKDNENTAFKNLINESTISKIAHEIKQHYSIFDQKKFKKSTSQLNSLELKQRVQLIAEALKNTLPEKYPTALNLLVKVIKQNKLSGFELWPISEFISQNGLSHFDESMKAMYILTQYFTSEFAIRPFFNTNHESVLNYFHSWTEDKNHHVRRWISEGSRPLLPWGMKLNIFIQNPHLTIELLNKLKFDEELYVRKSVANHLNDISKNHPGLVITTLKKWQKECPSIHTQKLDWIIRHSLRTLIKKGHPPALQLMGVGAATKIEVLKFKIHQNSYQIGDSLEMSFEIESKSNKKQTLIIDYKIYFLKSNNENKPKTFKLKKIILEPCQKIKITKKHSLRKITTMTYYKGQHYLSLQINGLETSEKKWNLI